MSDKGREQQQHRDGSGGSKSRDSKDGSKSSLPREQRQCSLSRGCSPARCANRGEVVVREIMRETVGGGGGMNLAFPMLTRSNYCEWALIMECNLHAASL